MKSQKYLISILFIFLLITSCTIQKRHYSKGFYFSWNQTRSLLSASPKGSNDTLDVRLITCPVLESKPYENPEFQSRNGSIPFIRIEEKRTTSSNSKQINSHENRDRGFETKKKFESSLHLQKETVKKLVGVQKPKNKKYEKQLKYSRWATLISLALFMLAGAILGESTSILAFITIALFLLAFLVSLISIIWYSLLKWFKKPAVNSDQAEELKLKSGVLENQLTRIRKKTLWILLISLFGGLSSVSGVYVMLLFSMIGIFIGATYLITWFIKALIWKNCAKRLNEYDPKLLTPKQNSMLNRTFAQSFFKIALDALLPLGMITGIILWFHYLLTN